MPEADIGTGGERWSCLVENTGDTGEDFYFHSRDCPALTARRDNKEYTLAAISQKTPVLAFTASAKLMRGVVRCEAKAAGGGPQHRVTSCSVPAKLKIGCRANMGKIVEGR